MEYRKCYKYELLIFFLLSSLMDLPDLSKWKTGNVQNINYMFKGCIKLKFIPNILSREIDKANESKELFKESELIDTSKFSKWSLNEDSKSDSFFKDCSRLTSSFNISKIDKNNIRDFLENFSETDFSESRNYNLDTYINLNQTNLFNNDDNYINKEYYDNFYN